jgi:hypothetical protein
MTATSITFMTLPAKLPLNMMTMPTIPPPPLTMTPQPLPTLPTLPMAFSRSPRLFQRTGNSRRFQPSPPPLPTATALS